MTLPGSGGELGHWQGPCCAVCVLGDGRRHMSTGQSVFSLSSEAQCAMWATRRIKTEHIFGAELGCVTTEWDLCVERKKSLKALHTFTFDLYLR